MNLDLDKFKINISQHVKTIFLYCVVAVVVALYNLLSMSISGVDFDLKNYLLKVSINLVIVTVLFAIGFPDGKNEAVEKQEYKDTALYFRKHIDDIIQNGKSTEFRIHCEVWNNNSLYNAIKEIIEIECGLDMSYLSKSKEELLKLVNEEVIDKKRYKKIMRCKNYKVKYTTIDANRILLGVVNRTSATYEYNENLNTLKILIPKIIQTMMFPLLFSLTLACSAKIDFSAIVNACASLITVLMSIIFAKNAGHTIVEQRRSTFIRWSDFIQDYKTNLLTEDNRKKV